MPERSDGVLWAAVAGVLGLCCALPVPGTLGLLGLLTGVSLASWTLVGVGVVVAAVGFWRFRGRRGGRP